MDDVFWRVVRGGLAPSIQEVKDRMTVADVWQAHLLLNREAEVERALSPKTKTPAASPSRHGRSRVR